MDYEQIFKKACLMQLSTSVWMGSRMLEHSVMERVGSNADWLRGRKFLINPELLGPIHTSAHQARNLVQKHSLPFPITGIYLVPKDSLSIVDERLQDYKARFWTKVAEFETMYEPAREEAKKVLGELFNESDYPADISGKFKFEWRYLHNRASWQIVRSAPPRSTREEKEKFI